MILKNYRTSILLLLGLLAGGILGVVLGENAHVLRAPGTLFLNLVFVLVVPLVFFSVSNAIVVMRRSGVMGKVLGTAMGVFLVMSVVAGLCAFGFMSVWNPFQAVLGQGSQLEGEVMAADIDLGEALVSAFTVSDFSLLLSREHLLPLILFALLFGMAVALLGPKAATVERFLAEGERVIIKMMDFIMRLAPIGIGCYFADTIGMLGGQIVGHYLEVFLVVMAVSALIYFILYSLYAVFCRVPLARFWKEMISPSVTALSRSFLSSFQCSWNQSTVWLRRSLVLNQWKIGWSIGMP